MGGRGGGEGGLLTYFLTHWKTVAGIDLVTETDKECEALIFAMLRAEFPTFEFMGEETASEGAATVGKQP